MGSFPQGSGTEEQVEQNIEPTEEAVDDRPQHALVLRPRDCDRERVAEGEAVTDAGAVVDRCHDGRLLGQSPRELQAYAVAFSSVEMCYSHAPFNRPLSQCPSPSAAPLSHNPARKPT